MIARLVAAADAAERFPGADRPFVAVAYEGDDVYDAAWSWETGQALAQEGYNVVAIADDGHMSIDAAQDLYDYERRIRADCFGPEALR